MLMKIKNIKIKEEFYPRTKWSWHDSYAYSKAMQSGSKFPPITVATPFKNRKGHCLVDGRHRIEAYKMNGQKEVSVEVLSGLSNERIYEEAIRRNNSHGKQFSVFDKVTIAKRLKDLKYTTAQISELIRVPLKDLKTFVGKRMTNTVTGDEIVLKPTLRHLNGEIVKDDVETIQDSYKDSQVVLLEIILSLLENKLINLKDAKVRTLLHKIYEQIENI